VGEVTVARVETGASVSPPTARKIAEALDVSVADLLERPPVPLAKAPDQGQPEAPARTVEEWEQTLAYVMEPVVAEALQEGQAVNRAFASDPIRQPPTIGDLAEAEAAKRFLEEFSPEERPIAFGEVALGRARFERDKAALQEDLARAKKLLRERDEKITQLKAGDARMREENARLRQDIAELRSEAEREGTRH
jgi:transcriptional regulator with XRE-family HTH domain